MRAPDLSPSLLKWLTLTTVSLGVFMGTLDAGIVNISLPALSQALGTDAATVLWVQAAYLLVSTGLLLTLGRLGDLRGRKAMYMIGFALFALGLGLSALSQNIYQLILFRLVQAGGQSMTVANSNAVLTSVFPSQERGKALGMMGAVVGAGLALGPLTGGWLIDFLGWQAIFYARVPISLVGLALAWLALRDEATPEARPKLDLAGAATSFVAMGSFLLWINQATRSGLSSLGPWAFAAVAAISGLAFLRIERRVEGPVVDLALFRSRIFALANIAHVLYFASYTIIALGFPFYLVTGLGLTSGQAGTVFTLSPGLRIALSPLAGWLSDRVGPRLLTTSGMALSSGGFLLLSRLGSASRLEEVVAYLIVTSLGLAIFEAPNMSAIMGDAPRERQGTASALVAISRQGGMTLGLAASGSLLAARQRGHAVHLAAAHTDPATIPQLAMVAGFHDTLLMLALPVSTIALVIALATTKGKRPR
ncbi:MAG: MFS transporter [Chloroflexi bacterium]|nr:MFS transporter [Chloroflexota bacterium]